MREILNRFKSPVVIIQILSIIVGVVIYFAPEIADQIKIVSTAIVSIINIFAGLNNPTETEKF